MWKSAIAPRPAAFWPIPRRCKTGGIGGGVRIAATVYTASTGFPRPNHRRIHRML